MTKLSSTLRAAALAGLTLPAAVMAQTMSGTSHPDDVIISANPDGTRQALPAASVTLQTRGDETAPVYTPPVRAQKPSADQTFTVVGPTPDVIVPATGYEARLAPSRPTRDANWPDGAVVGDEPPPAALRERQAEAIVEQNAGPDAGIVTSVPSPPNTLPFGTVAKARLLNGISTVSTPEGAEWKAELVEPLMRDGHVLLPAGSLIKGRVTEVHGGKRISGEAALHLEPFTVTLPDSSVRAFHAQVIDTSLTHTTSVDHEGTILRRDHKKEEAGVLALTTGSGATAGALIAGPAGALVGAGLGAGVSGVLWLKQDRQAALPPETILVFELTRPMNFSEE